MGYVTAYLKRIQLFLMFFFHFRMLKFHFYVCTVFVTFSLFYVGGDESHVSVCSLSGSVTAKLPTSSRCVYTVELSHDKHTVSGT